MILVVDRQGKRQEAVGWAKGAFAEPLLADGAQEGAVQIVEAVAGRDRGDFDRFRAVGHADAAVVEHPADPRNQPDGEGDDVVELVLGGDLADYPVEACLAVDRADEDLAVAAQVRRETVERSAIGGDRHAQDDDVALRDHLGRVAQHLGEAAGERLQELLVDRLQLQLHLPGPVAGPPGQHLHLITGPGEEGNEDVGAGATTDDGHDLRFGAGHG